MILIWLILIPFIAGFACWVGERTMGEKFPRWIALGGMLTTLSMSLWLWATGDWSLAGVGTANPQ